MKNKPLEYYVIFDERAESDTVLMDGLEKIRKEGSTIVAQKIDHPRETSRYAAEAAAQNARKIVGVGGDGMLNLVVNGILNHGTDEKCAVGLIPYGTANDFAGACGIPVDHPLAALDLVVHSSPVPIDIGRFNNTFFVNVITGGFPARAAANTSRIAKQLLGKFAYFLTGLTNIGDLKSQMVHFNAPGFEWEGFIHAFGLGNGRQAGGGFSVAPKAVINDGLLDLMIIPEMQADLLTLIAEYSQMTRLDKSDRILYIQVPSLNLSCVEPIHLNLDGEPTKGTDFHFKIHERRIPICLPEASPILFPPPNEN